MDLQQLSGEASKFVDRNVGRSIEKKREAAELAQAQAELVEAVAARTALFNALAAVAVEYAGHWKRINYRVSQPIPLGSTDVPTERPDITVPRNMYAVVENKYVENPPESDVTAIQYQQQLRRGEVEVEGTVISFYIGAEPGDIENGLASFVDHIGGGHGEAGGPILGQQFSSESYDRSTIPMGGSEWANKPANTEVMPKSLADVFAVTKAAENESENMQATLSMLRAAIEQAEVK